MKTNWETGIDMTPLARPTLIAALLFCLAPPAWGQKYLLYTPQSASSGQTAPTQEGILVQEIEIQKGDTLFDLSRKFSGHGMYFPQILLFNSIKNPNLIYAGKTLKVPVTQNGAGDSNRITAKPVSEVSKPRAVDKKKPAKANIRPSGRHSAAPVSNPSTELSLGDLKAEGKGKNRGARSKKKAIVPAAKATAGQELFDAAVKAYRKEDCRAALDLFDRYLASNSGSPLAADASLYKAECYLKLSAQ